MEGFKDIKGYEGLYKCSVNGEVFSLKTNKILKSRHSRNGGMVLLHKENKAKSFYIKRLIAETFLNLDLKRKDLKVINKDGNANNNNISNLEIKKIIRNKKKIDVSDWSYNPEDEVKDIKLIYNKREENGITKYY